ncbi:hypothetical protein [Streptomyces sp. 7N604]|uniref:hypothetical protein n=1 Tax=Streptomyces sp. 7N604 TaxID=3457415 RepID=UPI003FCEFC92
MRAPRIRRLMWPAAAVLVVGGVLLLFRINVVTGVLAPLIVAFLTFWFVHRFPQLRRPVAVTAKLDDVDYLVVGQKQVPASGHTVRLTVEAIGPLPVLLDRLRPVVVSRARPEGHLIPHLGIVEPRRFEVMLDADPPILRPLSESDGRKGPDFPFKVSADDPEVFDLTVHTETADIRWYLELDTVCLGRRRTTRIDLAGLPFRTMARPPITRAAGQSSG